MNESVIYIKIIDFDGNNFSELKAKVDLGGRAGQPESQGGGRLSLTHQEGTHQRQGEGTSFPA